MVEQVGKQGDGDLLEGRIQNGLREGSEQEKEYGLELLLDVFFQSKV